MNFRRLVILVQQLRPTCREITSVVDVRMLAVADLPCSLQQGGQSPSWSSVRTQKVLKAQGVEKISTAATALQNFSVWVCSTEVLLP